MSVASDFLQLLEGYGFGRRNTDIFIGAMPEVPNKVLSIMATGGLSPDRSHDGASAENPTIQFLFRDTKENYGVVEAEAIRASRLFNWANKTINGTTYLDCQPIQPPFPIGPDANSRALFSVNFQVKVKL